jgi:hypothetical protein
MGAPNDWHFAHYAARAAEYWHIGGIHTRFGIVISRRV